MTTYIYTVQCECPGSLRVSVPTLSSSLSVTLRTVDHSWLLETASPLGVHSFTPSWYSTASTLITASTRTFPLLPTPHTWTLPQVLSVPFKTGLHHEDGFWISSFPVGVYFSLGFHIVCVSQVKNLWNNLWCFHLGFHSSLGNSSWYFLRNTPRRYALFFLLI